MPVAALDDGKWHRAEVWNISGSDAYIYFFERGIRKYVKAENLRYLEKKFTSPSQKICKGSLAGVKPIDEDWSADAIELFRLITTDVKLYACVKGRSGGVFKLFLASGVLKTKISEFMIACGCADALVSDDIFLQAILVSFKVS